MLLDALARQALHSRITFNRTRYAGIFGCANPLYGGWQSGIESNNYVFVAFGLDLRFFALQTQCVEDQAKRTDGHADGGRQRAKFAERGEGNEK